jgi:hypothetical protein
MSRLTSNLCRGLIAGAAGTTALNAVTYLDMALRGRGGSDTPQRSVETLTHRIGTEVPGDGAQREHRLEGLGALTGTGTGVGVGLLAGLGQPILNRMPLAIAAVLAGTAAMAVGNIPMLRLGVSDPSTWSATDWLSDALPHLAYGLVSAVSLRVPTWAP